MILPYSNSESSKESFLDASQVLVKSSKSKRKRRQPMFALGDRRVGTDLSDRGSRRLLLQLPEMNIHEKESIFAKLKEEFIHFLTSAHEDWDHKEECRRFSIMGECITCARWKGLYLISSYDIVKAIEVLYRLTHMGTFPGYRRLFEEGILCDLRNLQVGSESLLEASNSDLLRFLYKINCVKTHKKQKVFIWSAVPFQKLFIEAISRQFQYLKKDRISSPRSTNLMGLNLRWQYPKRFSSWSSFESDAETSLEDSENHVYNATEFPNLFRFAEVAINSDSTLLSIV